ncbi:rho GTPase-activating protein 4-like [Argopecten irradians]|uniref:rho GTPase-activating protein 4-like n=1 Tax=Argopecten irradians TaxID=31199 RepID=UPI0037220B86
MTVHGQRSSSSEAHSPSDFTTCSSSDGFGVSPSVYPIAKMNRSWNGLVFQVSPLPNGGVPNGYFSTEETQKMEIPRSISDPSENGRKYPTLESPRNCSSLSRAPQTNGYRKEFPRSISYQENYHGSVPIPDVSRNSPSLSNSYSSGHYHSQTGLNDSGSLNSSRYLESEEEPEYVTLDNSYVFPSRSSNSPSTSPSKHSLNFRRNQLNGSVRSENIRIINNHIAAERDRIVGNQLKEKQKSRNSLKRIAENIGAALTPRGGPKLVKDEDAGLGMGRARSKSVGDLREYKHQNDDDLGEYSCCYSDDDDGDDFGFLSYPFASSSLSLANMSKNKSHSQTHAILPKKWRSKTKPLPGVASCMWSPQENCTWCSVSGRKVVLKPTSLLQLTEKERLALQKIALSKLQDMGLGCNVTVPKEPTETRRHKRPTLSFAKARRARSANLSALIDKVKDKDNDHSQDNGSSGMVFGIHLAKCIANDAELQKRKSASSLKDRSDDVILHRRGPRKSSSSSHDSLDNLAENGTSSLSPGANRRAPSSDSLSESDCSRNTNNSSLLDALSLSTSRQGSLPTEHSEYTSGSPQVPHIVNTCFKHIETYGLRVLGIFRVGSSKKRVKQLREEFDSGKDVKLNESHNPHDVGALLKEYFRDLPEPLLTRDLYSALVATRRLSSFEEQILSLKYLVYLLPVPNRDTLFALLSFLSNVDAHSTDSVDENNEALPGNKMDSHNLATLFGPNILHKCKPTEKEFLVESIERAEERKEVIDVVKEMVDNYASIFMVPAGVYDDILRQIVESDPEVADRIFQKLANDAGVDADPDTTSSSLFDDTESIPHSPCSEADIQNSSQRLHPPLRTSQSAENMSPRTRRRFFFSNNDNDNENAERERRRFRLRFDRSPSPRPQRTPKASSTRVPKVKVSDSASPEVILRRPRSEYVERPSHLERPHSENLSNCLAIPKPDYARQNSSCSVGSFVNTSSTNSPVGSDSSQWLLPTPPVSGSNSPKSCRKVSSSQQRPLGMLSGHGNDVKQTPPKGLSAWEREKWRQWEIMAAENADDSYEKETLV